MEHDDRLHPASPQLGACARTGADIAIASLLSRRRRHDLLRDDAEATTGTSGQIAFYGLANYQANPQAYNSSVVINTPLTTDSRETFISASWSAEAILLDLPAASRESARADRGAGFR
jgi:hypothetical protein